MIDSETVQMLLEAIERLKNLRDARVTPANLDGVRLYVEGALKRVRREERAGYVLAAAVLQSPLYAAADDELREAVASYTTPEMVQSQFASALMSSLAQSMRPSGRYMTCSDAGKTCRDEGYRGKDEPAYLAGAEVYHDTEEE